MLNERNGFKNDVDIDESIETENGDSASAHRGIAFAARRNSIRYNKTHQHYHKTNTHQEQQTRLKSKSKSNSKPNRTVHGSSKLAKSNQPLHSLLSAKIPETILSTTQRGLLEIFTDLLRRSNVPFSHRPVPRYSHSSHLIGKPGNININEAPSLKYLGSIGVLAEFLRACYLARLDTTSTSSQRKRFKKANRLYDHHHHEDDETQALRDRYPILLRDVSMLVPYANDTIMGAHLSIERSQTVSVLTGNKKATNVRRKLDLQRRTSVGATIGKALSPHGTKGGRFSLFSSSTAGSSSTSSTSLGTTNPTTTTTTLTNSPREGGNSTGGSIETKISTKQNIFASSSTNLNIDNIALLLKESEGQSIRGTKIVDIGICFKGEQIPEGYEKLQKTPMGHKADLNYHSGGKQMYLVVKRAKIRNRYRKKSTKMNDLHRETKPSTIPEEGTSGNSVGGHDDYDNEGDDDDHEETPSLKTATSVSKKKKKISSSSTSSSTKTKLKKRPSRQRKRIRRRREIYVTGIALVHEFRQGKSGECCPPGYTKISRSITGAHDANLNSGVTQFKNTDSVLPSAKETSQMMMANNNTNTNNSVSASSTFTQMQQQVPGSETANNNGNPKANLDGNTNGQTIGSPSNATGNAQSHVGGMTPSTRGSSTQGTPATGHVITSDNTTPAGSGIRSGMLSGNRSVPQQQQTSTATTTPSAITSPLAASLMAQTVGEPCRVYLCVRRESDGPPISDVCVIYADKEPVPDEHTCLAATSLGHPGNCNGQTSRGYCMQICYKRDMHTFHNLINGPPSVTGFGIGSLGHFGGGGKTRKDAAGLTYDTKNRCSNNSKNVMTKITYGAASRCLLPFLIMLYSRDPALVCVSLHYINELGRQGLFDVDIEYHYNMTDEKNKNTAAHKKNSIRSRSATAESTKNSSSQSPRMQIASLGLSPSKDGQRCVPVSKFGKDILDSWRNLSAINPKRRVRSKSVGFTSVDSKEDTTTKKNSSTTPRSVASSPKSPPSSTSSLEAPITNNNRPLRLIDHCITAICHAVDINTGIFPLAFGVLNELVENACPKGIHSASLYRILTSMLHVIAAMNYGEINQAAFVKLFVPKDGNQDRATVRYTSFSPMMSSTNNHYLSSSPSEGMNSTKQGNDDTDISPPPAPHHFGSSSYATSTPITSSSATKTGNPKSGQGTRPPNHPLLQRSQSTPVCYSSPPILSQLRHAKYNYRMRVDPALIQAAQNFLNNFFKILLGRLEVSPCDLRSPQQLMEDYRKREKKTTATKEDVVQDEKDKFGQVKRIVNSLEERFANEVTIATTSSSADNIRQKNGSRRGHLNAKRGSLAWNICEDVVKETVERSWNVRRIMSLVDSLMGSFHRHSSMNIRLVQEVSYVTRLMFHNNLYQENILLCLFIICKHIASPRHIKENTYHNRKLLEYSTRQRSHVRKSTKHGLSSAGSSNNTASITTSASRGRARSADTTSDSDVIESSDAENDGGDDEVDKVLELQQEIWWDQNQEQVATFSTSSKSFDYVGIQFKTAHLTALDTFLKTGSKNHARPSDEFVIFVSDVIYGYCVRRLAVYSVMSSALVHCRVPKLFRILLSVITELWRYYRHHLKEE
eukprot:g4045.t1